MLDSYDRYGRHPGRGEARVWYYPRPSYVESRYRYRRCEKSPFPGFLAQETLIVKLRSVRSDIFLGDFPQALDRELVRSRSMEVVNLTMATFTQGDEFPWSFMTDMLVRLVVEVKVISVSTCCALGLYEPGTTCPPLGTRHICDVILTSSFSV